ncbi:TetR/AcrR family transcriptional regulator [Lysinibacillus sp. SGAir0095]|uniref:TetR/AcrR family transcriptional regulator n=1 Tax=Lysinibacillus sp. SGAir0095 TaxID=2070463 RepID=UPI0010CCBB7C|nr:TetR/AcrR family transcriptional regulator [Lysinibacillus sp. SGAir0095]QCR30781.1 TetR family transcriptional regulator [Lysinibacillus sp. SGAir0095]
MDRRHEILLGAAKSFSMFGYKATTMEQVAKISNVGKGTIYNFFTNKEELLQEVVISMIQDMKAEAERTLSPKANFIENAHNGLMKMLQFREQHLLFAKLIEEEKAIQTPAVKQMLVKIEEEIVTFLADRLRLSIEKNEIRPCNPNLVAYLMFKSYLAMIVDWQLTHEEALHEDEILELFKETLFRGIATLP